MTQIMSINFIRKVTNVYISKADWKCLAEVQIERKGFGSKTNEIN